MTTDLNVMPLTSFTILINFIFEEIYNLTHSDSIAELLPW